MKKGQRFYHARVLDTQKFDGNSPQMYQVTRIAQGQVYYRAVIDADLPSERLGSPECCLIESWPKVCKELISQSQERR